MTDRRMADYAVTHDAMLSLLLACDGRTPLRLTGLPREPRVRRVLYDHDTEVFRVRILSPDHAEVPEGGVVPRADPLRIYAEGAPAWFDPDFFASGGLLGQIRRRAARFDGVAGSEAGEDRRSLLHAYDAAAAENARLLAELSTLRAVFANDMLDESVVARGAYRQGWRDRERLAYAKIPLVERRWGCPDDTTLSTHAYQSWDVTSLPPGPGFMGDQ